ncbi:zinc knuckle, partial [Ancylostoma caninum]
MIRQLKSMRASREDSRSLRNNLNDVQAIIATLRKQGEVVDTTHMLNMVLETFNKKIQEEVVKREFDSGKEWNMKDLLDNLTLVIRRREHLESRKDNEPEEISILHTRTVTTRRCTGCSGDHWFRDCPKYRTINQKRERLRAIPACWKCFSLRHRSRSCRKANCPICGGEHNVILCRNGRPTANMADSRRNRFREQRSPSREHPCNRRSEQRSSSYSTNLRRIPTGRMRRSSSNDNQRTNRAEPPAPRPTENLQRGARQTSRVRFSRSATPPRNFRGDRRVNLALNSLSNPQFHEEQEQSRLMVVPVHICNSRNGEKEMVYALLDSASDQSFISESLADRLGLPIFSELTITVTTFGGRAERKRVKKVKTDLFNTGNEAMEMELLTHEPITPTLFLTALSTEDMEMIKENFAESAEPLNQSKVNPELLIGIDYFNYVLKTNEPVIQLPSGLFATPTFFGPVISGSSRREAEHPESGKIYESILHTHVTHTIYEPNPDYSDLWKLPGVGIEDLETEEEENQRITEEFYSTVEIKDNKIYVRFPWKSNKMKLADNYKLAASRLHQLYKMRTRNPKCWEEYCKIINDQLEKKFIEEAPDRPNADNPCYYIPHQAVIKMESETTKTRIVLDASSKMKGELSLNEVIHQGPLILPHLCGILLRSRIGTKVMIADVEKAFH